MDRDGITAKIAELENVIQQDKLRKAEISGIAPVSGHTNDKKAADKYALCLGGGGGKGSYQLGVYRALDEYDLTDKITAISGTSIGAINAVLFACNDPDKSEEAWKHIHFETVFDIDPELMFNDKPGFMSRREMVRLMDSCVDYKKLSEGDVVVYATIAECIQKGERQAEYVKLTGLDADAIRNVILASSTLPMLYESVTYNGREYCDGGLADNIPVKPLYDMGCRNIIVCGLNPNSRKNISGYRDADIIEIYPSVNLGDLIDGTLNFSADSIKFRSLLGYKDAMRALKAHFENDPGYIAELDYYRDIDLADIKTQMSMEASNTSIQNTIDDIGRILGKLGIEK